MMPTTLPPLLMACLCAQWCGTCREYTATFDALARSLSAQWGEQVVCAWVDVEDHADALGGVDVENFPTLLLAIEVQAVFFGPVLPHLGAAQRLAQSCFDPTKAGASPQVFAPAGLVQAVRGLLASGEVRPLV